MDLNYLESNLRNIISESAKKISLLDSIRNRTDKKATKEEIKKLKATSYGGGFNIPALSGDIVSLMLEAKASNREKKGQAYKPFLIKTEDLSHLEFQYKISELIAKKEPFHYDCIIMTVAHCSPIQINSDGTHVRVFYIDAAGDTKNLEYAKSFTKHENTRFISHEKGGIQKDSTSCSIFSIQHLNKLTYASFKNNEDAPPAILSLSPLFLKDIQSTSTLDEYYKTVTEQYVDKKKSKTLQQHIDDYSITEDISDGVDDTLSKTKKVNYSIAYKIHKYLLAALDKLNEMKNNNIDIEQAINSRNSFYDKNLATDSNDHDLRTRMFQSIVDNNEIEKIKDIVSLSMDNNNPITIMGLIKAGADLNISVKSYTPIEWSIRYNHVELVRLLLSSSLYKDNKDSLGQSLIDLIVQYHFTDQTPEILNELVNYGVDINEKNNNGETIIFKAVRETNPTDITKRLIDVGVKIDVVNNEGNSPLHCVGNPLAAEIIINAGGDVHAKNKEGKTPLEVVLEQYINSQGFMTINALSNTISKLIGRADADNLSILIKKNPLLFKEVVAHGDLEKISAILRTIPDDEAQKLWLTVDETVLLNTVLSNPTWSKVVPSEIIFEAVTNNDYNRGFSERAHII